MPALRPYSAYGKTAGASIFPYPCNLVDLDGNLTTAAASGYFFQIHDKASAPSGGNVPVKSYYLSSTGPTNLPSLFQQLGPLTLINGLAVGISTSETTYTAATATYDVFGNIEEGSQTTDYLTILPGQTLITSGDTTTHVDSLSIGLTGDNQVLYKLAAANTSAGTRYIQIFAIDTPTNGDIPLISYPVTVGNSITKYYGSGGMQRFMQRKANTLYQGLYIACSTTQNTLTATGGGDMTCQALTRTQP